MRERKFRVYDKKIRKFSNFIINCKNSIEFMDDNTCGWYGENHERYKDFELMQYTGVKDKNGKEIYEGDIVNIHWFIERINSGTLGIYEDEEEVYNVAIESKNGCLGFYIEYCGFVALSEINWHDESFEIVGNIYENKELLGDDE